MLSVSCINNDNYLLLGVLKTILSFRKNAIPPQPFLLDLSADIDFESSRIVIPRNITAFVESGKPRLIGVSSFGLSGTLAHIILQEPSNKRPNQRNRGSYLYLLSARNKEDFTTTLQRHVLFSSSSEAAIKDIETACSTTQVGRNHYQYRRAFLVRDWRSLRLALQSCSHLSTPGIQIKRNKPKIGLWFSLSLFGPSSIPKIYPLMSQISHEIEKFGWAPQYDFFKQQLIFATSLRELGCDVTIVGGEGISEYVAGVFANIFQGNSVFQEDTNYSASAIYSVQCSKEYLNELLLDYRSDELSIYGDHGDNVFTLVGSPEAATELGKTGGFSINVHRDLLHRSMSTALPIRDPTIPVVSGHLGAVIDDSLVTNSNYWKGVTRCPIDEPSALTVLASEVDVVINIGRTNSFSLDHTEEFLGTGDRTFLDIVGRLYELGCNIDWSKISSSSLTTHLPSYRWAHND